MFDAVGSQAIGQTEVINVFTFKGGSALTCFADFPADIYVAIDNGSIHLTFAAEIHVRSL